MEKQSKRQTKKRRTVAERRQYLMDLGPVIESLLGDVDCPVEIKESLEAGLMELIASISTDEPRVLIGGWPSLVDRLLLDY